MLINDPDESVQCYVSKWFIIAQITKSQVHESQACHIHTAHLGILKLPHPPPPMSQNYVNPVFVKAFQI